MYSILVNDYHAGNFIHRQEMIEITTVRGTKKIYYVGKEGELCHCFRLNSDRNIIKVGQCYPFDLIDTKGSKYSKENNVFCDLISLDKKTGLEKRKIKALISWKLLEGQIRLDPVSLDMKREETIYCDYLGTYYVMAYDKNKWKFEPVDSLKEFQRIPPIDHASVNEKVIENTSDTVQRLRDFLHGEEDKEPLEFLEKLGYSKESITVEGLRYTKSVD